MRAPRRWVRYGLAGLGGVALLAIGAAGLFTLTFDPNTQKQRIIDAVRRATGRELVLAGPLRLTLGLAPVLQVEDAAFANRPGGLRPDMATVGRIEARVALLPLLRRRVEIASVTLDRPDILLETDAQGIGNWQFDRPVAAGPAGPAGPSRAGAVVALRQLLIENGRVTWHDGASGRIARIDLPRATLSLGDGPARLMADAQVAGQAVHVDGTAGQGAAPWPVKLSLAAAGATLALDGTVALPLSERSFHGRVALAAPDLAALGALAGRPGLPPLHDVRLSFALADGAGLVPQDVALHVGASDLGAWQPGATLAGLDLTLPALGEPGRLAATGSLPGGAWQATSGVVATRQGMAFRGLKLAAPEGDLAGDVAIGRGARWSLRGSLVSQRLDLDALRSLRRPAVATPAVATPASAAVAPPAPPPARVFSDAPLPWGKLLVADVDLQLAIAILHVGGSDYHAVATHLALQDGALRLDPFTVQAPEGRVDGSLSLDAAQPEPPVALALRSAAFGLGPVLQLAGLPGGSDAPVELDVALSSAGRSPHALASQLDGHVGLAMVDGALSNAALAAALEGALPAAAGRIDAAGRSAVRCLALRLDAAAGQVGVAALQLDATRLELTGEGGVDLGTEAIALRLRPSVRVGGARLLAPVRVEGSLARPVAVLDAPGAAGRPGLVIGGPPPPDECPAALALARAGRAGRLPAEATAKPGKPMDLLRSFLR